MQSTWHVMQYVPDLATMRMPKEHEYSGVGEGGGGVGAADEEDGGLVWGRQAHTPSRRAYG